MTRSRIVRTFVGLLAVAPLCLGSAQAAVQQPVSLGEAITETFTIEAIDHELRIVTLKDKDGFVEDVLCGPEVVRFDALKVGDSVTFRYYESLISAIARPGADPRPTASAGVVRTPGTRPGGTLSEQLTTTVTLRAIDPAVPSVRVERPDGRQMSFRIEDAKNLEGYNVGDRVQITYTRALVISVQ